MELKLKIFFISHVYFTKVKSEVFLSSKVLLIILNVISKSQEELLQ